ncbi:MAG: hypothetical protein HRT47_06790 [Candidatus Caenarcaniphilales bacterium]|nr:hypothetical protein [Candidatus Caenarcaniphilales bacterium]
MKDFLKLSLISLFLMCFAFWQPVQSTIYDFYHWVSGHKRYFSFNNLPTNWQEVQNYFPVYDGNRRNPFSMGYFPMSAWVWNRAGQMPGPNLIPLNMIPFGLAVDGVLFDPSGPWYDHGQALAGGNPNIDKPIIPHPYHPEQASAKGFDPNNVFDRNCTG